MAAMTEAVAVSSVVQKATEKTQAYLPKIDAARSNCLTSTNIPADILPYNVENGGHYVGKVRDRYTCEDYVALITTDRQSAFDRNLASVPFKGQVLNQTSAWWFAKTKEANICDNHILSMVDPNAIICKKCTVFPIEFVMRGYLTGSTSTSIWQNYDKGVRQYCGHTLPDGMVKNQKLASNLLTPTTKDDEHDELISAEEIVSRGMMTQEDWDQCASISHKLFAFGQEVALSRGLLLVDTKYELGKDQEGNIILIDEIHTPDSSRYWVAETYESRMSSSNPNQSPENIDKEFLRLWFRDNCDPYNDKVLPEAPAELVAELSRRYIMLYELITGEDFVFPEEGPGAKYATVNDRLVENFKNYLQNK